MFEEQENNSKKTNERSPYVDAIALLARRDYSRYKLAQKLKQKGHQRDEIESTIEDLIEKKYLQEDLYRESRVKGLINKGLSKSFIKQKMSEENCSTEMDFIDQIYQEMQTNEDDQIAYLIEKKLRYANLSGFKELQKSKEKALRFVISKGHSYSQAKIILENFLNSRL